MTTHYRFGSCQPIQIGLVFLFLLISSCASTTQPDNECIKGDCEDGMGTLLWADGAVYAGEWIAGKMHGSGVMRYSDGTKYTGQWYQGMMHGKGEVTSDDGQKYLGIWEANQFVKRIRRRKAPVSERAPCGDGPCSDSPKSDVSSHPDLPSNATDSPSLVSADTSLILPPTTVIEESVRLSLPSKKIPQADRPFDIRPPTVRLTSPLLEPQPVQTDNEWIVIRGDVYDESGIYKVLINGDKIDTVGKGQFESKVFLEVGLNQFELMVIDRSFNTTELSIKVNRSVVAKPPVQIK